MALFDYRCEPCGRDYIDVYQPIGSDALKRCPEGHRWARLIVGVRIEKGFRGPASLSPTMEKFWATGDPSVFPKGKPDADAFTLDDITDDMLVNDIAPDSPDDWVTAEP